MPTPQKNILVVEDDEMVQAFLALHLETEGYGVRTAGTAAQMIKALSDQTPDLILLDLNLPDGDGLRLARKVRENSKVPIIIATSRKDREDRLMGLGLGADDYVTKPFDPRELILRVRNLLQRSHPAPPRRPRPDTDVLKLPSPVTETNGPGFPATGSGRGRVFIPFVLAAAGVLVTAYWLSATPAPVQTAWEPTIEAPVMAARPSPRFVPAPDRSETPARFTISSGGRNLPEESTARSMAEMLGHSWALKSRCAPVPKVTWWKFKTHESIAAYVNRRHKGDWSNYTETWLRRLAKLQDILERESSAVTRTGEVLKGDVLEAYIGQIQKRLAVTNCLAVEAKRQASVIGTAIH